MLIKSIFKNLETLKNMKLWEILQDTPLHTKQNTKIDAILRSPFKYHYRSEN